MKTLKIQVYETGKGEPSRRITILLATFHVSYQLIPRKIKESLAREGIDLMELRELGDDRKSPKGPLIEIEKRDEKLVILIE